MTFFRKTIFLLVIAFLTQGCLRARLDAPSVPTAREVETAQIKLDDLTSTPLPTMPPAPASLKLSPTPQPKITISAANGNLYIRRGPGLEYDTLAILKQNTSADVIARDVLSNWVQILIPNLLNETGWVSIQTEFSKIDGDLNSILDFTFTEWPLPAYIKNCTEHDMYIRPGDIYLPSLYTNGQYKNEVQVNPGSYTAYDLFIPDEPEAQRIEIREGTQAYITMNGLGVNHKCP